MKKLIVEKNFNEKKLINYLMSKFDGLSLNTIYKSLRKKDIKVNNKRISNNVTIYCGDEITLFINDEFLYKPKMQSNLNIIFEDDNILIVNKPSGIEVLGNNSLTSILQKKYNNLAPGFPYPCHRLDTNTKGLIIFAKNDISLNILFEKFKNKEIEKHYLCRVYGIPKEDFKNLHSFLFKDSKKSIVYISDVPKKRICEN